MSYSIQELSEGNAGAWDDFNNQCSGGTFFHNTKWKSVLENTLDIGLKYWFLRRGQEIIGVFPLRHRTIAFLKGLDPIPYSEFNSILLNDNFSPRDLNEVLALFASKYSFCSLNMSNKKLLDHIEYNHYPSDNIGNMVLDLHQNPPESIWESFPAKKGQRKFIRRFDEKGFQIHEVRQHEDLQIFYQYYAENLMRINGDMLPLTFFLRLLETYSQDEMRVTLLSKGDIYAGGLLTFVHPASKTAYFQYLSLNRSLPNTYHPTYSLFWEGLNWAWDNGYQKISFGRQKMDPNNARFRIKTDFGAEYLPIYSRVILFSKATSLLYRLKEIHHGSQHEQNSSINRRSWECDEM